MLITDMNEAQTKALGLYLEVDSDYNPPSYELIAQLLLASGFSGSSSTVQRWAKKFDFEHHLNRHINALVLADKNNYESLENEAGAENLKRTLMTLEENAELLHGSHQILLSLVAQIQEKVKNKIPLSKDDSKIMLQLYSVTSAREDRLHDRQAGLDAVDRITKTDLLKSFALSGIDLEKLNDGVVVDLEIED